jgi:hypothetical protein
VLLCAQAILGEPRLGQLGLPMADPAIATASGKAQLSLSLQYVAVIAEAKAHSLPRACAGEQSHGDDDTLELVEETHREIEVRASEAILL